MAKLKGGILGKVSGAVGNVVTASWKGINYARDRVIPANPKSVDQMRIRNNMSKLVLLGRATKSLYIDTYWEQLVKGTANSGWAKFIGTAQKATQKQGNLEDVKLATGDLEPLADFEVTGDPATNEVEFLWADTVVSNGSASDIVYAHVYVPERNFVYSQSSSNTRNTPSAVVAIPDLNSLSGTFFAYATVKKADGSKYSTTQGVSL